MAKKNMKTHIELLRLIAIFLVIYNHTRADGFELYMYTTSPITYFASYTFSIFCKVAVPVFFMLSGALLIDKEESIKDLFVKRILRIVIVILVFTLLQSIRLCFARHTGFDMVNYLATCFSGNVIESYWYLKAYLGYLIVLPFLRAIAKSLDIKGYKYFAVLGLVKVIINIVYIITGYQWNVSLVICTDILFYPLLGHMLENIYCPYLLKKNRFAVPLLFIILGATVVCADIYKNLTGSWNESFLSVVVYPLSALLYIVIKNISFKQNAGARILNALGGCVFGVYLIEDVIRNIVTYRFHWNFSFPSPLFSSLLFSLVCLFLGLVCIFPIKKIPYVNKLI